MKKFIYIVLCFALCICAIGCGGISLDMNLSKDETPSWSLSGTNYEKSVFDIVRKDAQNKILGTGSLTLTLSKSNELSTSTLTYYNLKSELLFTHNNGNVDSIVSNAIFESQSVYCVYSDKTVVLQSNPQKNYAFVCDYKGQNKVVTYTVGENQEESTLSTYNLLSAHSGAVYDNETLYYLARAFNANSQQYGNFALTNLYDCYLVNNVNTYSVYYRTSLDKSLTDFTQTQLSAWGVSTTFLPTYQVSLSINGDMSGPPVELWYTDPDITFGDGQNKKVLAKIMTTNYVIPGSQSTGAIGDIEFTTTYTLSEYTTINE